MISITKTYIVIGLFSALLIFLSSIRRLWSWQPTWRSNLMPDRKGHIDNDKYYVEHYSEDTATISIEIADKKIPRFEMQKPFFHADNQILQALSNLQNSGVDYIDFGLRADWIAAEIPYRQLLFIKISLDELFRNVAKELLVIRNALINKEIGNDKSINPAHRTITR